MEAVVELAGRLRTAQHTVVLTGAGASTDSGLPDFRSKEGLWQGIDPMRLASMSALRHTPIEFYQFYRQRLLKLHGAQPNAGHVALAILQRAGLVAQIITQNVDGLHQAAGSTGVIEAHGSLRECVCLRCGRRFGSALIDVDVRSRDDLPACPQCGGLLKPGVVLFEEPLPEEAVEQGLEAARKADLFIVVGSSLEVGPINQLPAMAVAQGADLALINLTRSHLDEYARWLIRERSASVLSAIQAHLGL